MSTEDTDTPQTPDDENPRPRRRSPLAVVSVAAAVLVAGGGGAYWASTAADGSGPRGAGSSPKDGSPKPLALDAYATPEPEHDGIAPGEPDPHGQRYVATGKLPDGPDQAAVHLADAKVTKAEVTRLAKALDVPGSPRDDHGFWKVGGAPDANGPVLRVNREGPGPWSYSRYGAPGGTECVHPPGAGPDASARGSEASGTDSGGTDGSGTDGSGTDGSAADSGRDCPTYRGGDHKAVERGSTGDSGGKAVSEEKAKRTAEPVLKALGLADAKLDARSLYGAVRVVNADPKLEDLPTHGWATSLQVGADGQLVGGSGPLSKPEKDDSYPLISADEALKKLNAAAKGRVTVGSADCPSVKADKDAQVAPCEPNPSGTSDKVTVRKVTFGLAAHMVAGRRALVPSWIFETRPTGTNGVAQTVPYPAVKSAFIKKADAEGHGQTSKPAHEPKNDHITSYSVDGKTLTLHFWGGVCNTYSVSAKETSKQVTVDITSKPKHPGRACILIAKKLEKKVTLDKPLDGREVVDKSTGKTVPLRK